MEYPPPPPKGDTPSDLPALLYCPTGTELTTAAEPPPEVGAPQVQDTTQKMSQINIGITPAETPNRVGKIRVWCIMF